MARGKTAIGGGGAPAINNETLSQTDNCLPSRNGDSDVSIVARGNTAMSQRKKRTQPICKWTEGCNKYIQNNKQKFCKQHYNLWFRRQAGGGGAQSINSDTIGCGDSAKREEEQSINTSQLVTARLNPARRKGRY